MAKKPRPTSVLRVLTSLVIWTVILLLLITPKGK